MIVSRSGWGFDGWLNGDPPARRTRDQIVGITVHYDDAKPTGGRSGPQVPQGIHAFHKDGRGWAGIGYHFVITQAGEIFEGRGLEYVGAHCPGFNVSHVGVQFHIGGGEEPSPAALAAFGELRAWCEQQVGRRLPVNGHRDGYSTDCPGEPLYRRVTTGAWGAPAHTQETPMIDVIGAIGDRWRALGGATSALGAPTGPEVKTTGGAYTPFARGVMLWSPVTGAHPNLGAIRECYAGHGFEHGHLGYPVTDEVPIKDDGRFQHFEHGSIYWSPKTGAHAVYGMIREKWAAHGWENGPLGYPTSEEFDVVSGRGEHGRCQAFQGGNVYWAPSTGAWPVWGTMLERYAAQGWERGSWGFPGGPEDWHPEWRCWLQGFQGGVQRVDAAPDAPPAAAARATSQFLRPIRDADRFPISAAYRIPGSWAAGFHPGVDIACPVGTPVYATIGGDVRTQARGGWGAAYGTHVIISDDQDGDEGSDWGYCHLSRVVVHEGQHVDTGDLIGYSGNTGRTTGPHLHLERRRRGTGYAAENFLNPNNW